MKTYVVELTAHFYTEIEVEAESEEEAAELAMDLADEEVLNEQIEWDVDYIEELED